MKGSGTMEGRTPQAGDRVGFGRNECVVEVARLAEARDHLDVDVHAIVDQYGETHLCEDVEPSADEPAWEIVLPSQLAAYAA